MSYYICTDCALMLALVIGLFCSLAMDLYVSLTYVLVCIVIYALRMTLLVDCRYIVEDILTYKILHIDYTISRLFLFRPHVIYTFYKCKTKTKKKRV